LVSYFNIIKLWDIFAEFIETLIIIAVLIYCCQLVIGLGEIGPLFLGVWRPAIRRGAVNYRWNDNAFFSVKFFRPKALRPFTFNDCATLLVGEFAAFCRYMPRLCTYAIHVVVIIYLLLGCW